MQDVYKVIGRVATTDATVLIQGETGTGKELVAQAIHYTDATRRGPLVAVNCAALPEPLLESEFFGHEKGAFTGADRQKKGRFEQAGGGTLLLDEIGELPIGLQAKLLRVLQESEIRRVGDEKTRRVDARVLVATARDLEAEVRAGRFREDLFYRINVVVIALPPLRDRQHDIAPLARHFAARLAQRFGRPLSLTDDAIGWLAQQEWPGNVRELENAIERAAVLTNHEILTPTDFRDERQAPALSPQLQPQDSGTLKGAVEAAERDAITQALKATGGNRREAAAQLGVSLRTLFYKMDRYGIG